MLDTKDKKLMYSRQYYAENHDDIIAQKREYRQRAKNEVIQMLGGKCSVCGFQQEQALSVVGTQRGAEEGYATYYNRLYSMVNSDKTHRLSLICGNCKSMI